MRALHALGRAGRLAADDVPDARRRALLGRHLFSAGAALGPAELSPDARRRLRRLDQRRRGGHEERRLAPRASEPARSRRPPARPSPALLDDAAEDDPVDLGPRARQLSTARRNFRTRSCSRCSGAPIGGPATRSYRDAVLDTLTYLCQGGIYDHVGGGFARYSVDAALARPAFRKDALRQRPAPLAAVLRLPRDEAAICFGCESTRRSAGSCARCSFPAAASPRASTPTPITRRG